MAEKKKDANKLVSEISKANSSEQTIWKTVIENLTEAGGSESAIHHLSEYVSEVVKTLNFIKPARCVWGKTKKNNKKSWYEYESSETESSSDDEEADMNAVSKLYEDCYWSILNAAAKKYGLTGRVKEALRVQQHGENKGGDSLRWKMFANDVSN